MAQASALLFNVTIQWALAFHRRESCSPQPRHVSDARRGLEGQFCAPSVSPSSRMNIELANVPEGDSLC